MPIENKEEVTTRNSDPVSSQINQTATTTRTATNEERADARSDRGNAWIWYIVGIVDLLLALRLLFHLFGAKAVGFANMIYNISSPFAVPFRGIFPSPKIDGSYFDSAALVAIVVYVLLGWVISRLVDLIIRPEGSDKI